MRGGVLAQGPYSPIQSDSGMPSLEAASPLPPIGHQPRREVGASSYTRARARGEGVGIALGPPEDGVLGIG